MGVAYYNEKDPFAAAWLRNLIAANMIAPGDVDERSIEDVIPLELAKYTQCHCFAGIGVWSYSMRRAGWSDDRHAWTGSCPCQPFSQAGEGAGFADERHLWPAFFHLIEQCGPSIVFGEQVASKDGLAWLDLVQSDMEAAGYAFGALDTCAASFGAPHIRQRLYWMAYADGGDAETKRLQRSGQHGQRTQDRGAGWLVNNNNQGLAQRVGQRGVPGGADGTDARKVAVGTGVHTSGLADPANAGQQRRRPSEESARAGTPRLEPERLCNAGGTADTINGQFQETGRGSIGRTGESGAGKAFDGSGTANNFWSFADWLRCRDERWRPVEPGTLPLAHGVANRMGLLRGYGNAIVAPQAEEFIKAAMEYAP